MYRNTLCALSGICALILLFTTTHAQEEIASIDNSVFSKPVRPPAVFRHDQHNEEAGIDECNECHHIYEDGERLEYESSEDQMCSDCHSLAPSDNGPTLMKAFHRNCKGCHAERKDGPVMCGECHVKA